MREAGILKSKNTHSEVFGCGLCKVLERHPPAKKNEKRVFKVFAEFVVFDLEFPLEAVRLFITGRALNLH